MSGCVTGETMQIENMILFGSSLKGVVIDVPIRTRSCSPICVLIREPYQRLSVTSWPDVSVLLKNVFPCFFFLFAKVFLEKRMGVGCRFLA